MEHQMRTSDRLPVLLIPCIHSNTCWYMYTVPVPTGFSLFETCVKCCIHANTGLLSLAFG